MHVGGVVAGTSAGCDIQQTNIMITGGESYEGLQQGTTTYWTPVEFPTNVVTAYGHGGIGHFPYGLVDTHFENRGRQGRLLRLLADSSAYPLGSLRAFGVDENTALVVTGPWNKRSGTVIGQRGVMLMDTTYATVTSGIQP
jgi:cyanophycinase